jgi:4-hydroxybenzoate polyprenyltransferase
MSDLLTFATQIGRTSLLGVTFILVLLGDVSAEGLDGRHVWVVLAAATAYHVSVYAWNDVIDLGVDRTQPRRATSPLVRGTVSTKTVATIATAAGVLALALGALDGRDAFAWMGASLALLAIYNLFGKSVRWSPLTDLVQGAGWAALVVYASVAAGGTSRATLWIALYTAVVIVLVNGVHGAVRDLPNDHAAEARTTAILLGARPLPGGGVHVTTALFAYALTVQLAPVGLLVAGVADVGGPAQPVRIGLALAGGAVCLVLLARSLVSARHPGRAWPTGLAHILVLLALPVLIVASDLDARSIVLLVVLFGVPWASVGRPMRRGRAAVGVRG